MEIYLRIIRMVNSRRQKGNRIQRKLIEELQLQGYLVSKAEQGGKFNKEKDLFGLFDLVGIFDTDVYFIQVTTNRPHSHKDYQEFVDVLDPNAVVVQYVWFDRSGWKVWYYNAHEKPTVVDLRK